MSNVFSAPSFLNEIQEVKRAVNDWPQWMKDGTQVLVATTPELHAASPTDNSPRHEDSEVRETPEAKPQ